MNSNGVSERHYVGTRLRYEYYRPALLTRGNNAFTSRQQRLERVRVTCRVRGDMHAYLKEMPRFTNWQQSGNMA